jgi:hypothetical protein
VPQEPGGRSALVRLFWVASSSDRTGGRVERWRAHGSVRRLTRGFRRGPQSGSHGDVSSAPLRFRTAVFRQYGSKPRCVAISHALPPRRPSLSAKSAYPRALPGLTWPSSLMSLLRTPPALVRYRPASGSLSSDHLGPRALRSGRVMLSLPSTLSGPIRQSRPHPLTSQEHWLYRRSSPDDLVWAAIETFPALGQCSFHTCRHLYAGRRSRSISPMSPCSRRLPHQTSESAPPQSRPRLLSGGISTLPPVFALLRPARLLALLDRSDLGRHRSPAAEDFLPELSLGKVALPASRVSLYGTRGGRRDRTFTGRSTAVTGCTVRVPSSTRIGSSAKSGSSHAAQRESVHVWGVSFVRNALLSRMARSLRKSRTAVGGQDYL